MLRFKALKQGSILNQRIDGAFCKYYNEHIDFYNILGGDIFSEDKFPPFRDSESIRVINEIDNAKLVENEWYAMITPFGKTCLSSLSSGSKWALTAIYNSKHGIYTEYELVGDNVYKLLESLDMEILLVVKEAKHIPFDISYIIENYDIDNNGNPVDVYLHNGVANDKENEIIDGILHVYDSLEFYIAEKIYTD